MFLKIKNKKGIAVIEFMVMIFAFVLVLILIYGSWGVIHSGILNSIGARTYAFYSIAQRTDLNFYQTTHNPQVVENAILGIFGNEGDSGSYFKDEARFFAITKSQDVATPVFITRKLKIGVGGNNWNPDPDGHGRPSYILNLEEGGDREDQNRIRPNTRIRRQRSHVVNLKQGYGICLNARCGEP